MYPICRNSHVILLFFKNLSYHHIVRIYIMGKISSKLSIYIICEININIVFQKLFISSYRTSIVRKVTSELGIYTHCEIDMWVESICPLWAIMWALCTCQSHKEHTCPIHTWFFVSVSVLPSWHFPRWRISCTPPPVVWFSINLFVWRGWWWRLQLRNLMAGPYVRTSISNNTSNFKLSKTNKYMQNRTEQNRTDQIRTHPSPWSKSNHGSSVLFCPLITVSHVKNVGPSLIG